MDKITWHCIRASPAYYRIMRTKQYVQYPIVVSATLPIEAEKVYISVCCMYTVCMSVCTHTTLPPDQIPLFYILQGLWGEHCSALHVPGFMDTV